MNSDTYARIFQRSLTQGLEKGAFVALGAAAEQAPGPGGMPVDPTAPPMDPAMAGGAPPMDPAMAGGAPPMDPAMAGGAPPMDPAMAGGAPPMDPAVAGGAPMSPEDMGIDMAALGLGGEGGEPAPDAGSSADGISESDVDSVLKIQERMADTFTRVAESVIGAMKGSSSKKKEDAEVPAEPAAEPAADLPIPGPVTGQGEMAPDAFGELGSKLAAALTKGH